MNELDLLRIDFWSKFFIYLLPIKYQYLWEKLFLFNTTSEPRTNKIAYSYVFNFFVW